jgi:hypothetical protein
MVYKSGPIASGQAGRSRFRGEATPGPGGRSQEHALIMSSGPSATQTAAQFAPWTLRGLIASHKLASLVIAALCVSTVAIFVLVALGPKGGAVSDSTTCAQWGSTNVTAQDAYARLYVKEHGSVSPRWGPAPTGVVNAINAGCYQAFGEDVSDTATVTQAISRSF